jgi:hypothetical protein
VRARVAVRVEVLPVERIAGAVEIPGIATALLLVVDGGIWTTDGGLAIGKLQGERVGVGVGKVVVGGNGGGALRLR